MQRKMLAKQIVWNGERGATKEKKNKRFLTEGWGEGCKVR